ncbi:unnamed protein product, partial [Mesorhabditis belari]|uniref:Glycosyltransferase family 92 protein n=1 Tax=Mesorhabditis belari TaxID=2138241 RepID=A0AAF3EKI9_9BILA
MLLLFLEVKNRANDDQMVDQSKEIKKNKENFGPLNMEQYKLPDGSLDGKEIFVWYAFYDRRDPEGPRIRILANTGLVETRPFPLMPFTSQYNPNNHVYYLAEHLTTAFCGVWSDTKYTTMNDVDEIFYVRNRSETLLDVVRRQMNPAEYPGVGALNLDHHGLGFPDEPWDYGKFPRSSRPQKYIYQTEYAKLPWVHEMKNFFGNKKSQMLPTEQVIYLHMRNEMTNLEGTPRIYPDFQMFEDEAIPEMSFILDQIFGDSQPPFRVRETMLVLKNCTRRAMHENPGEDCLKPTGLTCYSALKDLDEWVYAKSTIFLNVKSFIQYDYRNENPKIPGIILNELFNGTNLHLSDGSNLLERAYDFFHDDIGWVKSCKNKIKLTEEWTRDWIENSIVRNQLNAIMQASCVVDRYFQRHLVPAMRDTFGMSKENVRKFRQSYYKIVSRYHNDLNACVWAALGNDGYTQSYKPWMASRDTIMVQILTESAVLDSIRPLTKNYRQTITESFKFLRRNLSKPLFDLSTFLKKGTIYYVS